MSNSRLKWKSKLTSLIWQVLIIQCTNLCPLNDFFQLTHLDPLHPHLTKNLWMSLQMKDNQNTVWDAVNEFKSIRRHLLWASMSQTDRYGQKIHSHWKQAASHRCCWQMTVAGHRQTRQEERRAPALHLIERTKAFRQRAREFSSSPGKPEKATWRDSAAKRTPPQYNNFTMKSAHSHAALC